MRINMTVAPDGLSYVSDVKDLTLPSRARENGELVVAEAHKECPYTIARVFTVRAAAGAVRGRHAHRQCSQFMICVHGAIEVTCDDGAAQKTFSLDRGNKALLVPPGIWATETYLVDGSVLSVLCDRPYEEDDYMRDFEAFLEWRRSGGDA